MKYIEIKAPAKINIGLRILSKRSDGYHNLHTLFYPINDLFDEIIIKRQEEFEFSTNTEELNTDDNLIVKTVQLLGDYSKKKIGASIILNKKIPIGAGLGGGSSNAAAVLISLNEMFALNLSYNELIELALRLGSDVPFFIKAKPAIGYSRGEVLKHIDFEIENPILIVNPGIHISTKEAFNNIVPFNCELDYKSVIVNGKPNYKAMNELVNDFEEYVFNRYPEIAELKEKFYHYGCLFAQMTGSGSTVYGIFENQYDAMKVIQDIPQTYFYHLSNCPD
ncbi:4-(cytidine 5'-diphospho)-2-C-methyl-D-erythritol kinase [Melioribacter sp. OK-6-Me]|uniref:4-(cytidine 5'-diphospho)-2-C-methyl-D-erythritol kinase n=1 Tax=unclassified Melioribacter TaxID=2627329 RepID=UPI003EDA955F